MGGEMFCWGGWNDGVVNNLFVCVWWIGIGWDRWWGVMRDKWGIWDGCGVV